MSTARVTLKFGEIPFEAFFAGAANVIFRHASTGVWVKEVREYASTRVREKSWWTLFGLTTKAGNCENYGAIAALSVVNLLHRNPEST